MPSNASLSSAKPSAARSARRAGKPFFGYIDSVLVDASPSEFDFDGAIARSDAMAAWTWMGRDLAPDLIDGEADEKKPETLAGLDARMPELLGRARAALGALATNPAAERRLMTQIGGEAHYRRLPVVLTALKVKGLLDKAQAFGRATNGMPEETSLATALQSMPTSDRIVSSLLMHATVGQVANPHRLMTAAVKIAGSDAETAVVRVGFGPLGDALLAHAQNQLPLLTQGGPFADMDLTCKALDRFHRLHRALNGYVELTRNGRWAMISAALTKSVSERVEPMLRSIVMDLNKALRRHREGTDRLDSDQLLASLNGIYLLATVRDARDSLAVNATFEQTWSQVGQTLEIHIQRNLDLLRADPSDRIVSERLDASIKMAELRFNTEYAEVLRRAKEAAEKRQAS
jgi:hypothetical protein